MWIKSHVINPLPDKHSKTSFAIRASSTLRKIEYIDFGSLPHGETRVDGGSIFAVIKDVRSYFESFDRFPDV
jgi:hypothetical protein